MGRRKRMHHANPLLAALNYVPLAVFPIGVLAGWWFFRTTEPRWVLMWSMAISIFGGCKWLTWCSADLTGVSPGRQAAYLFLWPGLDAEAFCGKDGATSWVKPGEWLMAALNLALGIGLFWGVASKWPENWPLARGWTGMTGFICAAHCGVFNLLSCLWRSARVNARPLMNWPLLSCSLSEFWGKRWNTAFRDFSYRFLFSPLARRLGPRTGLAVGFIFSGVVHEMVVTIPAGGGYGGPTLFFGWQGLALLLERSRTGGKLGLGHGWRGWAFAVVAIMLPVGIAFPPVFVENVVLPMMKAMGALS